MSLSEGWNEADLLGLLTHGPSIGSGLGLAMVEIGPGDDAAVVELQENRYSICADLITENVHFDLEYFPLRAVGFKAIAVNISDLAAMSSTPLFATVTIAAPKSLDLLDLLAGIKSAAETYGIAVIGGDLSASNTLTVSVTAFGINNRSVMLRSCALAGETIMVTGPLGGSQAGLKVLQSGQPQNEMETSLANRHLFPVARVREGVALGRIGTRAAMDISDGLLIDLWRLCDASGVGFDLSEVPIAAGATLDDALSGGEDYELLFTTDDPQLVARTFSEEGLLPPTTIGRIVADIGSRTLYGEPCAPKGYLH